MIQKQPAALVRMRITLPIGTGIDPGTVAPIDTETSYPRPFRASWTLSADRMMMCQNDQFEVAEWYYHDLAFLWPAKAFQPIDTQRIKDWDKVTRDLKEAKALLEELAA
jgi:hypothetical protein